MELFLILSFVYSLFLLRCIPFWDNTFFCPWEGKVGRSTDEHLSMLLKACLKIALIKKVLCVFVCLFCRVTCTNDKRRPLLRFVVFPFLSQYFVSGG